MSIKKFVSKNKEYIISITAALTVGAVSTLLTKSSMEKFEAVKKPPLTPPSIVFPFVWTALFVLMGVSAARVYKKRSKAPQKAKEALIIYAISLFFNFFWSIIFFNMREYFFAFAWLIALWVLIIMTICSYKKIDKIAAYLQIPYFVWVSFAGYINLGVYLSQ